MNVLHAARVSRAPLAGLASVGVFWGGFAALVPDIKAAAAASDSAFGVTMLLSAVGSMVMQYLAPQVGRMLGRRLLPVAGAFLAAACLLPLLATSVWALAAALFGMGMAVAMLDIGANVRISVLESRHGMHLMNLNHAMFSFAFALTAGGTAVLRSAGYGPGLVLPLMALLCLGLAALMREGSGWEDAPRAGAQARAAPPWPAILATGFILFAAFIAESSTAVWSALHIERTLQGSIGFGSWGPMMLGLTMGFGRLSGQFVAERIGEGRLILWSSLLGVGGGLVVALAGTQGVALVGIAMVGIGIAVIVPSANSILGKIVSDDQRSFAISRGWLIGFSGMFVGPTVMGLIAETLGLRAVFGAIALVLLLVVPLIRRLAP